MKNSNIIINSKARTIEVSKAFERASRRFGSDAYKLLQEAKAQNLGFKVVIKARKSEKKVDNYKGLTFKYMEDYIANHDDENATVMYEFKTLRGQSEEAESFGSESCSYMEIKAWFLKKYPAVEEFQKKREALLAA